MFKDINYSLIKRIHFSLIINDLIFGKAEVPKNTSEIYCGYRIDIPIVPRQTVWCRYAWIHLRTDKCMCSGTYGRKLRARLPHYVERARVSQ